MRKAARILTKLAVFMILTASGAALAAEETSHAASSGDLTKFALALAAGFGIAIASAAGATAQGRSVAAAMEGLSRNPSARDQMFIPLVLGLVLIESLVIYSLIICFMLVGKI